MFRMFSGTSSSNGDISSWDTSVTNMSRMFSGASSFNGDLSSWDTSSVTNMGGMFDSAASFDQNLSNWYVTIGNTSIERADIPDVVRFISAQNSLDGQNPTYGIVPGGDSDRFAIDGNHLSMV